MSDSSIWTPWERAKQRVADQYGWAVGRRVEELPTPALMADRGIVARNLKHMAQSLDDTGVALRPHTKVQKSPELARLQIDAGAVGVTVATVWEAAAMAAAGIEDILIANQVVGPHKIAMVAELARSVSIMVAVDNPANVADLADAARRAGTVLDLLIEADVGMGRCGVRSAPEAEELARAVADSPWLRLQGVQAYEGHCMLEPSPDRRTSMANQAMDQAAQVLAAIRPMLAGNTLSGGGTGTFAITSRHLAVTELQAGSYVFMDAMHANLVPDFDVSLHVLGTVVSVHGTAAVVDVGRKSIGIDYASPRADGPSAEPRFFAEEHAMFDLDTEEAWSVGDRVKLVSGYAPTTVNLHDVIFVVEAGVVVDLWTVFPRGPSDHGFLQSFQLLA